MRPIPIPFPFLSLCFSSNLASLTVFILACTLRTLSLFISLSLSLSPFFLLLPLFALLPARPCIGPFFVYDAISTWKCPPWGHVGHEGTYTTYFDGEIMSLHWWAPVIGRLRERAASSLSLSLHGLGPDFRYGPAERRKSAESVIYPKWSTVLPVKSTG